MHESEMTDSVAIIIFLVVILLPFVVLTIILLKTMLYSFSIPLKKGFLKYMPLSSPSAAQLAIIKNNCAFYNQLNTKQQKSFIKRVKRFIYLKEFIPRGGLEKVTEEMKLLIACCAIQMTFGFPKIYFEHFTRILIYPDNYYSTITRKFHQGEVNTKGIIVLSWSNFQYGFLDKTDGINLGFHELAHAIHFENLIFNNEYNFFSKSLLNQFWKIANQEINSINSGKSSLLRPYAANNLPEFFAVVVENFFERPSQLHLYNRELYLLTAKILNQEKITSLH